MIARFVTAAGTGVGKTLVTAALAYQARKQGKSVHAIKPVVTGLTPETQAESDPAILLAALGRPLTEESIASVSPFRFALPLAPAMAAAEGGKPLSLDALVASCRPNPSRADILLIEGIGGVMVPLAKGVTVLDWIAALGYPVILVAGSYLGTLSHTLTAAEALCARKIPIAGIVVSETKDSTVELSATARVIGDFVTAPVIALPRILGAEPWSRAPDLTPLLTA